eukprot:g1994.t1
MSVLALLLLLAPKTVGGYIASPTLKVSPPRVLLSHSQMQRYRVGYPDANLVAVKDEQGYRFWMDGAAGKIDGVPGRPWSFMQGGATLSAGITSLRSDNVGYWRKPAGKICPTWAGCKNETDLPCVPSSTSYASPCVTDADSWHGGKALMWIGNVYRDDSGGILGFIHMEFSDPRPEAEMCFFRFALGYSRNGGSNFTWLGYIAEPEVTYEHSMFGQKYGRPRWYPNMGLPSYIIKDGFFQVYYGDSHDLKCTRSGADVACKVQNTTVGGAGNPDQGVAVVRAKIDDVIEAAKKGKITEWKKYFEGKFNEPGMGGKFTPLSLQPQGYMHGDAAYCEPLKLWVLAQQSGGRIRETKSWRQQILLAFSPDGLAWSDWQVVYNITGTLPKGGQVVYPSLMSLDGPSNEVLGSTFAVVFQVRQGNSSGPPFQYSYVNVTVSARR